MTVGGSIMAAELACKGHVVFHPSGGTHHGRPDRASGFCYFNDPVFCDPDIPDNWAANAYCTLTWTRTMVTAWKTHLLTSLA